VVAVSDSRGGIIDKDGLDIKAVTKHKNETGSVAAFAGSRNITNSELLTCECDILIPAALSDQLNAGNAGDVMAKVVLELANAPTTKEADKIFFEKNILLIPDVLANAGGVVVSYFEWSQNLNNDYWEENKVLERLKKIMITSFDDVYSHKLTMRTSAYKLAIKRILHAEKLRGNL